MPHVVAQAMPQAVARADAMTVPPGVRPRDVALALAAALAVPGLTVDVVVVVMVLLQYKLDMFKKNNKLWKKKIKYLHYGNYFYVNKK